MTSRTGYILAALLLFAGMAVAGSLVWSGIAALQNALNRFVVPGTGVLTLDEPGSYTIFHESDSVVDGKLYSAANVSGLRVIVTAEADGKAIPVTEPSMTSSYSIGGHSGKSVLAFDIATPGRYRLSVDYPGGRTEPVTVLAVSHGFMGRLVSTILGAVAASLAGFAAALALVLTTYFRRRRLARSGLA